MMKTAFVASCASMAMLASANYTLSEFRTKLFWKRPDQGYYDVDVGLQQANSGARIMNISDLNNDKLNDLVVTDAAGEAITVYYFDETTSMYSDSASFSLPQGWLVDNVMPTNADQQLQGLIVVASQINGDVLQNTQLF